ncbi:MAG: PqiC family protein [Planctomycetota bacterium]
MKRLTLAILLAGLAGCGSSKASRFYYLKPIPEAERATQSPEDAPVIGVGPITIPQRFDRPNILTTTGTHELRLAEFHRWAEPMEENLANVLGENLAALIGTDWIYYHPWRSTTHIDYQVSVRLLQVSGTPGGTVTLTARWTIYGNQKVLVNRKSVFSRETAAPKDKEDHPYEELIAEFNELVNDLSREIAEAIRQQRD